MFKTNRLLLLLPFLFIIASCGNRDKSPTGTAIDTGGGNVYDVDKNGIPKFVEQNYIELQKIGKISLFRSAAGHDYSDDFESCRSMKHYYWPLGGEPGQTHSPSWSTINIFSPVQGKVSTVFDEWAGTQVQIQSKNYPAFYFILFHVSLANPLKVGDTITQGQWLGMHIGEQTMSDISVGVNTTNGWKRISFFDVMTDTLFQNYQARGISSRDKMIISKSARDADPLNCNGQAFSNSGSLDNWVILN